MWCPSVGPTGDPDGLDPSKVPEDVPISLLHGSSFCEWWKMSFRIVLPITLVCRNLLAWHHNQCLPGKGRNLSHEDLPNPLQRCCVKLDKFHAFASQPQS